MRRLPFRSIQLLAWTTCIVLQVCVLVWQWNVCSVDTNKESGNFRELAKPATHAPKPNNQRKKDLIQSRRPPLPLSSSHIRVFPRLNKTFPCYQAEDDWDTLMRQQQPATHGFLYVKARKAGSSSVASVAIRIARNMARRANIESPVCRVRFNHPMASKLQYSKRKKAESFLWSILREPTKVLSKHSVFFCLATHSTSRQQVPHHHFFFRYSITLKNSGSCLNFFILLSPATSFNQQMTIFALTCEIPNHPSTITTFVGFL